MPSQKKIFPFPFISITMPNCEKYTHNTILGDIFRRCLKKSQVVLQKKTQNTHLEKYIEEEISDALSEKIS
jgi:hypothetical protein